MPPAAFASRDTFPAVHLRTYEANDPPVRHRHQMIVPAIEAMVGQLPPQEIVAHGPRVTERRLPERQQSPGVKVWVVRPD